MKKKPMTTEDLFNNVCSILKKGQDAGKVSAGGHQG